MTAKKDDDLFDTDFGAALEGVDSPEMQERLDAMQAGGGEIVEASDECEGGACKI
jgi:hypothetical protein